MQRRPHDREPPNHQSWNDVEKNKPGYQGRIDELTQVPRIINCNSYDLI